MVTPHHFVFILRKMFEMKILTMSHELNLCWYVSLLLIEKLSHSSSTNRIDTNHKNHKSQITNHKKKLKLEAPAISASVTGTSTTN